MDLIYWSVCSSSKRGGVKGGIISLASCGYHFISVHETLQQVVIYRFVETYGQADRPGIIENLCYYENGIIREEGDIGLFTTPVPKVL